jgi:hypothetical protein
MLHVVKFQLARYCNRDLGGREVARVRDVHLIVFHTKLHPYRVVIAEYPY